MYPLASGSSGRHSRDHNGRRRLTRLIPTANDDGDEEEEETPPKSVLVDDDGTRTIVFTCADSSDDNICQLPPPEMLARTCRRYIGAMWALSVSMRVIN